MKPTTNTHASWQPIKPNPVARETKEGYVTFAWRCHDRTKGRGRMRGVINLSGAVCEAMGWAKPTLVRVQLSPDRMQLALTRTLDPSIGWSLHWKGRTASAVVRLECEPEASTIAKHAPHRIEGDTLIVEMPQTQIGLGPNGSACQRYPADPPRDEKLPAPEAQFVPLGMLDDDIAEGEMLIANGWNPPNLAEWFGIPVDQAELWCRGVRNRNALRGRGNG